jgi:hypothetical protein
MTNKIIIDLSLIFSINGRTKAPIAAIITEIFTNNFLSKYFTNEFKKKDTKMLIND